MHPQRTPGEQLAARILESNPDFGSAGYRRARPPMLNAIELLERLRASNITGRHLPGPWKVG